MEGRHQPIVTREEFERVQKLIEEKNSQMEKCRKNRGVYSDDLWRKKMRCQCGHAFAKTKWHIKTTDFTTYTYKCYDQTQTGTVSARIKNGLSIEGICPVPLVQDWKMNTMAQYRDVKPATEADVSGKLEDLRRLMGQFTMPEDGEREWFKTHPQWSKSNKYAELEARIYI